MENSGASLGGYHARDAARTMAGIYPALRQAWQRRGADRARLPAEPLDQGRRGMNQKQLEERRAFKDAFRARVALIAAERQLQQSEIAWTGRIKHYDLMCFARRHRVSLDWLLTGDVR